MTYREKMHLRHPDREIRMKKNPGLRKYAQKKGVLQWEIAEAMHVSEACLSRWLSSNLHPAQYRLIVNTIDRIAAQKAGAEGIEVKEEGPGR